MINPMSTAGIAHESLLEEARALTAQIVDIKDKEGLSFPQIAARLTKDWGKEIKVTRVRRLYYTHQKKQNSDAQDGDPHASIQDVSIMERKMANHMLEGESPTKAAQLAGSGSPSRFQNQVFKRPKFKRYFEELLENNGLTENHLAKKHMEELEANRTLFASKDGEITETLEVPDHQTRMNAVKVGWELRKRVGSKDPEDEESPNSVPPIIVITPERKRLIEKLIGRPLDCQVIDDPANFAEPPDEEATTQTEDENSPHPPSPASSEDEEPSDPPGE